MRKYSAPRYRPAAPVRKAALRRGFMRNASPRTLNIGYQARAGVLQSIRQRPAGRRLRPNRGSELLAAIAVVVLFAACGAVYFSAGLLCVPDGTIYSNIFINGVNVGGRTGAEAVAMLSGKALPDLGLELTLDGRKQAVAAGDIGAHYDVEGAVARALAVGHEGGALRRLSEVLALRRGRRNFTSAAAYSDDMLKALANGIASSAGRPGTDAAMQFLPDTDGVFNYTGETPGVSVDAGELHARMKEALDGGRRELAFQGAPLAPGITAAVLKGRTQLLGTCTTALGADAVRNRNIRLAGGAVNGTVIMPGEEFSFNGRTGGRTADKGYADAPAISNGKLVDAPGGGVCQVSSTVYNAALLAGLEIVERHHHSWPVSYVPVGFDSTVDWASGKDLRIKTARTRRSTWSSAWTRRIRWSPRNSTGGPRRTRSPWRPRGMRCWRPKSR
jgi:vancomycin resistance protein YoaR